MKEKIKILLQEDYGVEHITDETRFKEDLNFDSLDKVEMAMLFEEHFNIELDTEEAQSIETFNDLVEFIECQLNTKSETS